MSTGLNITLTCYDDVALSIIKDFWDQPDKFSEENKEQIPYRYSPYPLEQPSESPIKYKIVCTGNDNDPFMLQTLSATSSFLSEDSSLMSSDSCLSMLSNTIDSIDIPSEWLENIEELPTLDESSLFEALELIEKEPITASATVSSTTLKKVVNPDKRKDYCCIICDKYFLYGSGLKKHFRTKTHKKIVDEKLVQDPVNHPETWKVCKYFCFICGQGFPYENQVVHHIVNH